LGDRFIHAILQVIVVAHERQGVQAPVVLLHRSLKPLQSTLTITVIEHDVPAPVSTGRHGIQRPRKLDPHCSGHACNPATHPPIGNP